MYKVVPYAFKLWLFAALTVPAIESFLNRYLRPGIMNVDFLDSWLHYGASVFFCMVSTGPCLLLFLVSAVLVYTHKIYVISSKFSMLLLSAISLTLGILIISWGGKLPANITWLLVNLLPVATAIWILKPLTSMAKDKPVHIHKLPGKIE